MSDPISTEDSSRRISSLETQVTILLIALVALTGPMALYFFRQASDAGKEYTSLVQVINTYNANAANIKRAITELSVYGETHRDIVPLLEKYGVPLAAPTAPRR